MLCFFRIFPVKIHFKCASGSKHRTPLRLSLFHHHQYLFVGELFAVFLTFSSPGIMPRTSAADQKMVDDAVKAMKKHPTISVREAMVLAGFSPDESVNKNIQRNILRRLPGQGKRKFVALQILHPTPSSACPAAAAADSVSPLTEPTIPEQESEAAQRPPPQKRACSRLNSQQKQNERVSNLLAKANDKAAHKAVTKLYSEEREKGQSGMSLRQVAQHIKSVFGRGPSISTIYKYVVKDKLIGVSPLKNQGQGNKTATRKG